ncbi:multicopper oxidase [Bacillus sp. RO1]|uniref:multicopper oxidase family protein n=1 Tax=Bacillus sp. RO1 TaxID=2722703 RepID=UPI001456D8BB|nr:multicopper oxidase [Bacillus sp. RO1]NLP51061.1 multicopper oxidase domain-containing protein [Bacillus sp. RO1]
MLSRNQKQTAYNLTKYKDALPVPPVLKHLYKGEDYTYYEVCMKECKVSVHSELPETVMWGYEGIFPGPTIQVQSGERVYIKWKNQLPPVHLLPIDFTVHGAHRDVPEVRTVVHVHGAVVEPESDGYPDAWFTNGYQQVGEKFVKQVYQYDNYMDACTLWYHDHALGITRLNIYAGLAGFFLVRSKREQSLNLPAGEYDIPLLIQDRTFNQDGSLYYPKQPEEPVPGLVTSIVPEFFGETILVNGKVWPYLEVEPRKYRFRMLNGSNSRFYRLKLDRDQLMFQIGTDRGLLPQPIGIKEIILAPAERADIIIDFSNLEGRKISLINGAPAPFPSGEAKNEVRDVMQFRVISKAMYIDTSSIPAELEQLPILSEKSVVRKRLLTLDHLKDEYGRELMLLDNKGWDAPISENPRLGTTEIWYLINLTPDTHPIHIHLIDFQILDRREFNVEKYNNEQVIEYLGPSLLPEPQERGRKDTVRANPNEITRLIMQFGPYSGLYVWHCHMLEHEDYEMMRPYIVIR